MELYSSGVNHWKLKLLNDIVGLCNLLNIVILSCYRYGLPTNTELSYIGSWYWMMVISYACHEQRFDLISHRDLMNGSSLLLRYIINLYITLSAMRRGFSMCIICNIGRSYYASETETLPLCSVVWNDFERFQPNFFLYNVNKFSITPENFLY